MLRQGKEHIGGGWLVVSQTRFAYNGMFDSGEALDVATAAFSCAIK